MADSQHSPPNCCPKCGGLHMYGPSYIAHKDMLRYTCGRCGYAEHVLPADAPDEPPQPAKPQPTHTPIKVWPYGVQQHPLMGEAPRSRSCGESGAPTVTTQTGSPPEA